MKRLTISVPDDVAAKAQRAVEAGDADSVSGYFAALGAREPDWVMARQVIDEIVADAGEPTDADREWVRRVLGRDADSAAS